MARLTWVTIADEQLLFPESTGRQWAGRNHIVDKSFSGFSRPMTKLLSAGIGISSSGTAHWVTLSDKGGGETGRGKTMELDAVRLR